MSYAKIRAGKHTHKCQLCFGTKPLSEFYKDRSGTQHFRYCIDCSKAQGKKYRSERMGPEEKARRAQWSREWRERLSPKEKAALYRKGNLKSLYGMTVEEYSRRLAMQGGCCAICNEPPQSGRNLHVDHCHESGGIRGLLCSSCNTGMGLFDDDPSRLDGAIRYLEKFLKKEAV
jgi:hypothetical protein